MGGEARESEARDGGGECSISAPFHGGRVFVVAFVAFLAFQLGIFVIVWSLCELFGAR